MPLFSLAGNGDIISLLSQNEIKKKIVELPDLL
jgi:hypothetical protein